MATITVVDNATTPTGATAVIAGSSGAANSVYVRRRDQVWAPGSWTLGGTRTGDGSVSLTLDPGVWWYYLQSGSEAPTPPEVVLVTDGLWKPPSRCRAAVLAQVQALALPAVGEPGTPGYLRAPQGYYEQIVPDERNAAFPAIIATAFGEAERRRPGLNGFDEIGYPVWLFVAARVGPVQHAILPAVEAWRYAMDRAFDNQVLPGVPESVGCTVEPKVIIDQKLPLYQFLVTGLVVVCWCRVPRGLGV